MFVEIFLDLPETWTEAAEKFQLVSADGEYDRTMTRAQASLRSEGRYALTFTNVIAGQKYTLYHYPAPETRLAVFSEIPFDVINKVGGTSSLAVVKAEANPQIEYVEVSSEDPVLFNEPGSFDFSPYLFADPHEMEDAFELETV